MLQNMEACLKMLLRGWNISISTPSLRFVKKIVLNASICDLMQFIFLTMGHQLHGPSVHYRNETNRYIRNYY